MANDVLLPETRVGQVLSVEEPQGLRNRAWIITIDFGSLGIKKSVGQFRNLTQEEIIGRKIVAVVGLGTKKVGAYVSECLVLGTPVDEADRNAGHYPLAPGNESKLGQLVG